MSENLNTKIHTQKLLEKFLLTKNEYDFLYKHGCLSLGNFIFDGEDYINLSVN